MRDIETIYHPTKKFRIYKVNGKLYPSVTSVLSLLSRDSIEKWKNNVGEEYAETVRKRAALFGTSTHDTIEKYLHGEKINIKLLNIQTASNFRKIKPILDDRVGNVIFQEKVLFSNKYRIAGKCDLFGMFDGKLSLIDFKTSTKFKEEEYIESYFIQETAYCCMIKEMFDISIENIVTIFMTENEPKSYVYQKNPKDYVDKLKKVVYDFYTENPELLKGTLS